MIQAGRPQSAGPHAQGTVGHENWMRKIAEQYVRAMTMNPSGHRSYPVEFEAGKRIAPSGLAGRAMSFRSAAAW